MEAELDTNGRNRKLANIPHAAVVIYRKKKGLLDDAHYMIYDRISNEFIHMILPKKTKSAVPQVTSICAQASRSVVQNIEAAVISENANDFVAHRKGELEVVTKFNNPVLSDPDVIARALECKEKGKEDYNLFNRNCQHFALWCKTGKGISQGYSDLVKLSFLGTAGSGIVTIGCLGIKYGGLGLKVRLALHAAGYGLFGPVFPATIVVVSSVGGLIAAGYAFLHWNNNPAEFQRD